MPLQLDVVREGGHLVGEVGVHLLEPRQDLRHLGFARRPRLDLGLVEPQAGVTECVMAVDQLRRADGAKRGWRGVDT